MNSSQFSWLKNLRKFLKPMFFPSKQMTISNGSVNGTGSNCGTHNFNWPLITLGALFFPPEVCWWKRASPTPVWQRRLNTSRRCWEEDPTEKVRSVLGLCRCCFYVKLVLKQVFENKVLKLHFFSYLLKQGFEWTIEYCSFTQKLVHYPIMYGFV